MEKRYDQCKKVLQSFQDAGILQELILIGSWCLYFYQEYFSNAGFVPLIRTRDIDFLVPTPVKIKNNVDVAKLLEKEGFIVTFSGDQGYMKLMHPDLIVEFLVPEKGRGSDKAYPLPQLGMNAQPLRFLDYLVDHTISIEMEGLAIRVPHPTAFSLHKLLISTRRKTDAKLLKEQREAFHVMDALVEKGEEETLKDMFRKLPVKWQKKIMDALRKNERTDILEICNNFKR